MNSIVSIIIPTFNRAHLLSEALDSILAQTYCNWECIIVDDGSSDNTEEVLESYLVRDNRFKYYKRPEYKLKGPSSCRNYGIEKANGDYIIFLDSDDLLIFNCLENRVQFAIENKDFDFWIFKMNCVDTLCNNIPNSMYDECLFYLKELLKGNIPFTVTCPLWRTEKLKLMEGFDENMDLLEDPDLHIRVFLKKLISKTAVSLEPDCIYRVDLQDKKRETDIFKNKLNNVTYYFLRKHLSNDSEEIKWYSLNYFKNRILLGNDIRYFCFFYKLLVFSNVLTKKQIFFSPILFLYNILKITNIKGVGYTRLRKITFLN